MLIDLKTIANYKLTLLSIQLGPKGYPMKEYCFLNFRLFFILNPFVVESNI